MFSVYDTVRLIEIAFMMALFTPIPTFHLEGGRSLVPLQGEER